MSGAGPWLECCAPPPLSAPLGAAAYGGRGAPRGLDPRHILGVSYVASPAGLRALRVVGAVVGAAAVALLVGGALRRAP